MFRSPQLCHPDRRRSSRSEDLRSGGTLCLMFASDGGDRLGIDDTKTRKIPPLRTERASMGQPARRFHLYGWAGGASLTQNPVATSMSEIAMLRQQSPSAGPPKSVLTNARSKSRGLDSCGIPPLRTERTRKDGAPCYLQFRN